MSSDSQQILEAPGDLAGWIRLFDHRTLPILAETAASLSDLAQNEDGVDAHLLAETVSSDPLMILKLLAHVAELRGGREGGSPETALEAIVMLGVPPFFRAFAASPSVEAILENDLEAFAGFRLVLERAHRAARFAMGFAVHRMDNDAAIIHEAALLHDFAELLLWIRAPSLARAIRQRQIEDPALRSSRVQLDVLHVEVAELQHALMLKWRLPPLLTDISDAHSQHLTSQVRNVQLAIRIARHSSQSWNNVALPDDISELGELLQLGNEPVLRLLRDIDAD